MGSIGRDAGRQRMRFEYKGRKDVAVNGRKSRGARRGKGGSVLKQGSRPGEYTKEELVGIHRSREISARCSGGRSGMPGP